MSVFETPDPAASRATSGAQIVVSQDIDSWTQRAAELVVTLVEQSTRGGSPCRIALAGGETPKRLYNALAEAPYRDRIRWNQLRVYWGDERPVGPEDPESNYRMTEDTLLSRVPILPENIYRVQAERGAAEAALEYEATLRETFNVEATEVPRFNLILLGMGNDGHTASLFPESPALAENNRLVVDNYVERLQTSRITLTVPVLNNAAAVAFLVNGEEKAATLRTVIDGPQEPEKYPAQLIAPRHGSLFWMLDVAAAGGLHR